MDFKKRLFERTECEYHPVAECQLKNRRQSKIHRDREGANTIVYHDEQSSCPKHVPVPDADNVLYKYVCTDTGANAQSKPNSYKKRNKDTMPPRDKVCPCKAHPDSIELHGKVKRNRFPTLAPRHHPCIRTSMPYVNGRRR